MKTISTLLLLPVLSGFASADTNPNSLDSRTRGKAVAIVCQFVNCRDVEPPTNAPSWCKSQAPGEASYVIAHVKPNTFADHGAPGDSMIAHHDGDQYSLLSFDAEDMKRLSSGAVANIPAHYSDGYWWSDGDHIRYVVDLTCRKAP